MSTIPGLIPITQSSFANGAGNARDSAIQQQLAMNQKQNDLNRAAAGGSRRRRRKYRGGANSNQVTVPQFQMQYSPTGGPGTNPNDQVAASAARGMQSNANSVYDNKATTMGGKRRYHRGGNPNWNWGCYSGGKSKRCRKSRKNCKKTRRYRRR